MSNGRTDESNERGDGGNRRTVAEPGGGPRRVVSEKSVDDILAFLEEEPANESGDGTGTDDESSISATAGTTAVAADVPEPEVADDRGSATGETSLTPAREGTGDEPDDGTKLSYVDDELAGRVAANDVTGADVRAAETDADRESTPEIDDVDLTLDDLEGARIGASPSKPESEESDDRSPADESPDEGADGESDDGSPGLFRRLLPW